MLGKQANPLNMPYFVFPDTTAAIHQVRKIIGQSSLILQPKVTTDTRKQLDQDNQHTEASGDIDRNLKKSANNKMVGEFNTFLGLEILESNSCTACSSVPEGCGLRVRTGCKSYLHSQKKR